MAASKWASCTFAFAEGYHAKVKAEVAGKVCSDLAKKDRLTAANLVDVSRPEDAPLHPAFEWQDAVAAEAYRRYQANNLIHSLRVIRQDQAEPQRVYFNLERRDPTYKPISVIVSDDEMRDKMLKMAYGELIAFRKKYSELSALSNVFAAIDKLAAQ